MKKYNVEIERSALKALKKIPNSDKNKIVEVIQSLENISRPNGAKKLTGRDAWRIRVGNYRIIYEIKDHICHILIIDVGHRKDIYS